MIAKKIIFGKKVSIDISDMPRNLLFLEEMKNYPDYESEGVDLEIIYKKDIDLTAGLLSVNPSHHWTMVDGMIIDFKMCRVRFYFSNKVLRRIDFHVQEGRIPKIIPKAIGLFLSRAYNVQCSSRTDYIAQIFHQSVLVPSAMLSPGTAIVHCSGVVTKDNKLVLLGGTGGVGKTSMEMELCLNDEASFFADDIAVVDEKGSYHPNLCHPKIYSYNVTGEKELERSVLKGRGFLNRLHWAVKAKLNPSSVLRTVDPAVFYGEVTKSNRKANVFLQLFRCDVKSISIETISAKDAARSNAYVIQTEYEDLFSHLYWEAFNRDGIDKEAVFNIPMGLTHTQDVVEKSLEGCDCYLVKLPLKIDHTEYKTQMRELIETL